MNLNCILDATKRQKETITNWCNKAGKNPDEIIAWAEGNFKNDNEQLAAAKWYIDGKSVNTFKQALYICGQKKLDPLKQDPETLVSENADLKQKEKPINPDDVLTGRFADKEGNVIYLVRDEDREVMREIINTHYGKSANPWCLMQADDAGKLTERSLDYWQHYSAYPKQVAFRNGKLLAFSAGENEDYREWWDRFDRSFPFIPYDGKTWYGFNRDVFEIRKGDVFMTTPGSKSRLSKSYSENVEEADLDVEVIGGKEVILHFINPDVSYPIAKEDDKYYYVRNPYAEFKVDKDGLCLDGPFNLYYGNDEESLQESGFYKNGKLEGPYKKFYENGQVSKEDTYHNGKNTGVSVAYYENGQVSRKCNYDENGLPDGLYETFHKNGNPHDRYTYVHDHTTGPFKHWYESGSLKEEGNFKDGNLDGEVVHYYENGEPREVCQYADGKRTGKWYYYSQDGKLTRTMHFRDGYCISQTTY